jgi:hypothetical protein
VANAVGHTCRPARPARATRRYDELAAPIQQQLRAELAKVEMCTSATWKSAPQTARSGSTSIPSCEHCDQADRHPVQRAKLAERGRKVRARSVRRAVRVAAQGV